MKRWRRSQREAASLFSAKETPASGSRPGRPGDFETERELFEHKCLSRFRIEKAWLGKIAREALPLGKVPVLSVEFCGKIYTLVPLWAWRGKKPGRRFLGLKGAKFPAIFHSEEDWVINVTAG